ncbi:hypothetical protein FTRO_0330020 [Fructobacillus tropaeoli]|uniref:Uncharacterized protein n=1 Tax=Fructobacillus tropaeoli TaxID=709323 RepID=A0A3F3H259_9LACO|nr:hypothetical protein FTRO_0330020 [Fructobacillus tropaeoli]
MGFFIVFLAKNKNQPVRQAGPYCHMEVGHGDPNRLIVSVIVTISQRLNQNSRKVEKSREISTLHNIVLL